MSNKLYKYTRSFVFNKKLATFFVCLLISSFLWLINALNRNYTKTIALPVKYVNLPKNKILAVELPKFIQAEVKTTGAKLFFIEYNGDENQVIIDASQANFKNKTQTVAALNTLMVLGNLSRILKTEVELIKVKPDSIYFTFGKSYKKIVPVKPVLMINFDPFYNYTNSVSINPSTVTLYGDSAFIAGIDSVNTEKIVLNDFNSTISQKAKIQLPEDFENRVGISSDEVDLKIEVDKYTEAYIELPVETVGVPSGYELKTFPDKVKVTVQVPMKEYEKLNTSVLRAVSKYSNGSKNQLKVDVTTDLPNIKITKISPEKVEYILRK